MEQAYAAAGIEPPLEELLEDQIARLLMRRDGIGLADVWRCIEAARAGLPDKARSPAVGEGRGSEPTSAAAGSETASPD